jgi:MFS family permease
MATKKAATVIPLIMTSGLCVAGNAGILVPLLEMTMKNTVKSEDWSSDKMSQRALIALSVLGFGEILGAIVFGKIMDKFGNKMMMYSNLGCFIISILCICVYVAHFRFSMWFGCLICFGWGVQESGLGVFLNCILGFEFKTKTTTFAFRNLVQSFVVFAALFLDALLLS